LIVGVDIGGSFTKAVALEGKELVERCTIPTAEPIAAVSGVLGKLLTKANRSLKEVSILALSGAGSRFIGQSVLDIPVVRVDEITAIGIGGLMLSGKNKALVVSMGTGTALVVAYRHGKIEHIGGTGVGGGTIRGLGKLLLGRSDFQVLEDMASRGNLHKVDLTVGDIAGGAVGVIPADATASNFGNVSEDVSREDIAAGVFNLVSEVIGVIISLAAKAYNLERDIVLVGRLAKSKIITSRIVNVCRLFGTTPKVPEYCDYCVAIGAAKWIQTKSTDIS